MVAQTLTLAGRKYAVVLFEDFQRLLNRGPSPADHMPPLPAALPNGNYPAIQTGRALLARDIISRRRSLNISQAELARRAKVRVETLNRIEKARVSADVATVDKIAAALDALAKRDAASRKRGNKLSHAGLGRRTS